MSGGYIYIQQEFPKFQYSDVRFALSKVAGGVSVVNVKLSQENCAGVLIRSLTLDNASTMTPALEQVTITDSRGIIIVATSNKGAFNEKKYFDYYIPKARSLKLSANTSDIFFLVEYQFLTLPKKNDA